MAKSGSFLKLMNALFTKVDVCWTFFSGRKIHLSTHRQVLSKVYNQETPSSVGIQRVYNKVQTTGYTKLSMRKTHKQAASKGGCIKGMADQPKGAHAASTTFLLIC